MDKCKFSSQPWWSLDQQDWPNVPWWFWGKVLYLWSKGGGGLLVVCTLPSFAFWLDITPLQSALWLCQAAGIMVRSHSVPGRNISFHCTSSFCISCCSCSWTSMTQEMYISCANCKERRKPGTHHRWRICSNILFKYYICLPKKLTKPLLWKAKTWGHEQFWI